MTSTKAPGPSFDEFKRILQANKYEHDEILPAIDAMSREKPEHNFLVPLSDWPENQKNSFLAFRLLHPEALEILFKKDQNPLYAWRAYQNCREHKIPIPDWVLAYLDSSAGKLLDIEFPEQPAHETYAALGLNRKGRGTLYKRFLDADNRFKAVCEVISGNDEALRKIDIYGKVADRMGVETSTIQKWCKAYMHLFNPPK
jgi:hypothetical protein